MTEDTLERPIYPLADPDKQWADLERKKIPLSIPIKYAGWSSLTQDRLPDLTLAHYLAARHIVWGFTIPDRIKDAVADEAKKEVRETLTDWNKNHSGKKVTPWTDREFLMKPLMTIVDSAVQGYMETIKDNNIIGKLAEVLYDLAFDFPILKYLRTIDQRQILN